MAQSAGDLWWKLSPEEKKRMTQGAWVASLIKELDIRGFEADDDDEASASYGVPASKKAIWELYTPTWGETSSSREQEDRHGHDGCAVCLEGLLATGQKFRMMPCHHSFHELCIFKWLVVNRVCPICQFALPSEEEQRLLDRLAEEACQPIRKKKRTNP